MVNQNRNNAGQNEKVYYSKVIIDRPMNAPISDIIMFANGFLENVRIQSVRTPSGEKLVANLDVTVTMTDKRVMNHFGKEMVRADHKVRFHVSYWQGVAQAIADDVDKGVYARGSRLFVGLKNLGVKQYTNNDGMIFYSINATGIDFPIVEKAYTGSSRNVPERERAEDLRPKDDSKYPSGERRYLSSRENSARDERCSSSRRDRRAQGYSAPSRPNEERNVQDYPPMDELFEYGEYEDGYFQ